MNIIKSAENIVQELLKIKKEEEDILPSRSHSINFSILKKMIHEHEEEFKINKNKQKELLVNCNKDLIRKILTLYYYGNDIVEPYVSFYDILKRNLSINIENIIDEIIDIEYRNFLDAYNEAKEKFEQHEKNVAKEKEYFQKRENSYIKKGDNSYFNFQKKNLSCDDIEKAFLNVQKQFNITQTNNIKIAKQIIEQLIKQTNGGVVVDFLKSGNCDYLEYVECDDEILKIYWRYSKEEYYPRNMRIDIAFDKLEFIKDIGIVLKGYYRSKKELKDCYFNKEKILNKSYSPAIIKENKTRSFRYYNLIFDKKQRGSIESFDVTFIPWRHYTVLIQSFHNNISDSNLVDSILIWKNLQDIQLRVKDTIISFEKQDYLDEDDITMYGNRFRKILEGLLKFILLASNTMFKENYKQDMIGDLLQYLKKTNEYNVEIIPIIIETVEKDLLNKLNLYSHENVSHKIDKKTIDDIYLEISEVLNLTYTFFGLKIKNVEVT